MNPSEWVLIRRLSRVLFEDPSVAEKRSADTLAALESSCKFREDQLFEATTRALLRQVQSQSLLPSVLSKLQHKYFDQLTKPEQLLLFLIKEGSQTYQKIYFLVSGVYDDQTDVFEKQLWELRSSLAQVHPKSVLSREHLKPYWSQRFLDDQITPEEFIQIQNHLSICKECQDDLKLTQKMLIEADSKIPSWSELDQEQLQGHNTTSRKLKWIFAGLLFLVGLFALIKPLYSI